MSSSLPVVTIFLMLTFNSSITLAEIDNNGAVTLSQQERKMGYKVALLAGGCFWCLEPPYENLAGVIDASVGYCGGSRKNADYYQVTGGGTKHLETVRVVYDPKKVTYNTLLDIFWKFIDPTDDEGQYDDRGSHYRTAIFYVGKEQQRVAEDSKKALTLSGKYSHPIATRILPAAPFYLAEERHQNFYQKRFSIAK